MRSKNVVRQAKEINHESDDDPAFSAEDTDQESSDDQKPDIKKVNDKRKRDSSDSDPDDPPEKEVKKKKKLSKTKSKYNRNTDSESDPDDPPEKEDSSPKKDESKEKTVLIKKSITPYTDEEMREKFKYKRHKCVLDYLPTKTNKPIGKCRRGRPAELKVDEVKLHYVVHYKEHGLWDHIVPEEGENEGKIDSYECKVCLKKFKNSLEKKIYQGRGSSICHVATEHGRLLRALINEGGLAEEIEFLAQHDKSFNDAYNEYFENKEALYGASDEEIISIKPSLVWKIYAKNDKNDGAKSQNDSTHMRNTGKENYNSNQRVQSHQSPAPSNETLICPFKEELKCQFKPTTNCHSFRMHFFQHYPVDEYWLERLKNLEQGEKCYYCDLCTQRKRIKGDTPQGIKKSMVCHLAIQHQELRPIMDADSRLTPDFVNNVYYDVDQEKQKEEAAKTATKTVTTTANTAKKESDDKTTAKTAKSTSTEIKKASSPNNSAKTGIKKTVGKYKPGPKSKTRPKEVEKKKKQRKQKSDDSEEEEDDDVPDLSSDLSSDESAKKSKGRKSPDPKMPRQNENYVRKRKPLNLTLEDLEADEAEDENWEGSRSNAKANKFRKNGIKPRETPKRRAAEKKATFSDESE